VTEPHAPFTAAVRALSEALGELGVPWLVIGGIAVIARGVPRATIDIDATIWAPDQSPEFLLDALCHHQILPRIREAAAFARERQVLLLRPRRQVSRSTSAWRPRDVDDAEKLLLLFGRSLDLARVRRVVREFSDALEEPARISSWEGVRGASGHFGPLINIQGFSSTPPWPW
jgi:hypothetical protein